MFINLFAVKMDNMVKPAFQVASIGDTVYFTCQSNETVRWYFEGKDLSKKFKLETWPALNVSWLRIIHVQYENSGMYECIIEKPRHLLFYDNGILTVNGMCSGIVFYLFLCKTSFNFL